MKTKKLWYGLLVGVASMLIAYACQNDVAPVEKAGQEAGTALVDKAKAYFESAIRQQVYTRGVADVYEESQEAESGFIPSDYTPMWSRSFVAEEGNWKQVAAPVASIERSYVRGPDGQTDELAQAVVYREEAGETSCRMLVLWATDGRDAQTAVESFVGNAGQSDFTGVAWYLSLDGQVEKIEAYENGKLIADNQTVEGLRVIMVIVEGNLIFKKEMTVYSKAEALICPRCGMNIFSCECCIHYPNPKTIYDCSICGSFITYCTACGSKLWDGRCLDCGGINDDPLENCKACGGPISPSSNKCVFCGRES